jgi:hypothetical protein
LALKALYFALSSLKGKEESTIREKWDSLEREFPIPSTFKINNMQKGRGVYKRRKKDKRRGL